MQKILNAPEQWLGELKFPENESNQLAYSRCVNDETAKKYCPVRWKSINKWGNVSY